MKKSENNLLFTTEKLLLLILFLGCMFPVVSGNDYSSTSTNWSPPYSENSSSQGNSGSVYDENHYPFRQETYSSKILSPVSGLPMGPNRAFGDGYDNLREGDAEAPIGDFSCTSFLFLSLIYLLWLRVRQKNISFKN